MATKVTLRLKPISGSRQSLYLDFYPPVPHPETKKQTRREVLSLYIFSEIELTEQKYTGENGEGAYTHCPGIGWQERAQKSQINTITEAA